MAHRQGRTPAAIMRDAIAEYVRTHEGEISAAG
jgi:predicted transcriptional regulator